MRYKPLDESEKKNSHGLIHLPVVIKHPTPIFKIEVELTYNIVLV